MSEFDKENFKEYWRRTEVIREYQRTLYTFGDMELPYVFVAEHSRFSDRTVVKKGVVMLQKPHILLPKYYGGPEFSEGFEHAEAIPAEAVYLFRAMRLPYSRITNRLVAEEGMEYGKLQDVLVHQLGVAEDRTPVAPDQDVCTAGNLANRVDAPVPALGIPVARAA